MVVPEGVSAITTNFTKNASFTDEEGGDGCKGETNLSHLLSLFVSLCADLGLVGGTDESLLTMELIEMAMEGTEGREADDSTLFVDVNCNFLDFSTTRLMPY